MTVKGGVKLREAKATTLRRVLLAHSCAMGGEDVVGEVKGVMTEEFLTRLYSYILLLELDILCLNVTRGFIWYQRAQHSGKTIFEKQ